MTTPMSTRAIVWGKWLGLYRIVFWLALLPGLAAAILACVVPSIPARFMTCAIPPNAVPLSLGDRIATPALVVFELLSYGAAIASLGLLLAIWIARPGRAIAVSVAIFVLIAVGWLPFFQFFVWRPLQKWLELKYNLAGMDIQRIPRGTIVVSPLWGPAITLGGLGEPWGRPLWKFNLLALSWCLLAWAFAGAMFWAAPRSFDRRLGRMRETSQGDGGREGKPPRLVAVGVGCENGVG